MRELTSFSQVAPAECLAVVVSYNTRAFTSVAVLSAGINLGLPLLVIDSSSDGTWEYLKALRTSDRFMLVRQRRRRHGEMLDYIFQSLPQCESILLVDSDVEVLDSSPFEMMRVQARRSGYGAGLLQKGTWMTANGTPYGWYAERPWMPFSLFKTAPVSAAVSGGQSFLHRRLANDLPHIPWLSYLLMWRWRLPVLRKVSLDFFGDFRDEFDGVRPAFVYLDTGANLHRALLSQGHSWAPIPQEIVHKAILHFGGATRRQTSTFDRTGTSSSAHAKYLREREEYYSSQLHMTTT